MEFFKGEHSFCLGTNYWSSKDSINMWENWDAQVVERDFKLLSDYGIQYLRIFLVWPVFQPLKALWANAQLYEYRMMPGEVPLPDTEAGQAGVSEEACKHFEEFCRLADKYHMKLIVGLLTGHMSFRFYAPEAFEGRNFLSDPTLIKWEIRFVRYFVKRFKNETSILAWDLGNECNVYGGIQPDQAYVWTQAITSAIRDGDTLRPVISGFDNSPKEGNGAFNIKETGELLDILTSHPYHIFSGPIQYDPITTIRPCIHPIVSNIFYSSLGNKPCFIEEIGSIGYVNCSEKTEMLFARTSIFSAWAHHCNGYFWWCAFDQGQLEYAPYDWNNIGSDYGLFRSDGTPKPIAEAMKKIRSFLQEFPYADLPQHLTEGVCIISRGQADSKLVANASFILAKQAGFDITFAYAEDKLPDSDLYLLPSVTSIQPIFLHRFRELLKKVRNGATLYISTDQLFRLLPDLTGLTIAEREKTDTGDIVLGKDHFVLQDLWKYHIETVADTCTVLARTKDGEPFFVCNEYGNGKIYYMAYKPELMLGKMTMPFARNKPPYYQFYKYLPVKSNRVAKSTDPLILTTEHIVDEETHIVVAINYNHCDSAMDLKIAEGWKLQKIYYGSQTIPANDAYIAEIKKLRA